jgi:hypothetical protein
MISHLNLHGYGNIFSMSDKSRALHGKLSYWKRLVVAKNTAALPSWMDFLDENEKNEPPIVPESTIV